MDEMLVDIHCHLLPYLDDGAQTWDESLAMARLALADGIGTIVATPHQLGVFAHNGADLIRQRTREFQAILRAQQLPLRVLAGADVRLDATLLDRLRSGEVLTLADSGRHLLVDLPREPWAALPELLDTLRAQGLVVVLAHPERHPAVQQNPQSLESLVVGGCLLQVTADSLAGSFGVRPRHVAEWLLRAGWVHFVSSGAHGAKSRRPLMRHAFLHIVQLVGVEMAVDVCCRNPAAVAEGREVVGFREKPRLRLLPKWLRRRQAG